MIRKLALFVLGGAVLAAQLPAAAQVLGGGLTFDGFKKAYQRPAHFDGETALTLDACRQSKTPSPDRLAISCDLPAAGSILLMSADKSLQLKDISVEFNGATQQEQFAFRRVAKYAISGSQSATVPSAAGMVTDLMVQAHKAPGKTQMQTVNGVRYSMTFRNGGGIDRFSFAATVSH